MVILGQHRFHIVNVRYEFKSGKYKGYNISKVYTMDKLHILTLLKKNWIIYDLDKYIKHTSSPNRDISSYTIVYKDKYNCKIYSYRYNEYGEGSNLLQALDDLSLNLKNKSVPKYVRKTIR